MSLIEKENIIVLAYDLITNKLIFNRFIMNKYVILLTACINPDGMAFTKLTNPDERKKQYVDTLQYYLVHSSLPIVFAENSNTDISHLFEDQLFGGRLEILSFNGNNNKKRGKGYGEAEIIDYAMKHSHIIDDTCCLVKITGRLIVQNIQKIVESRRFWNLNESIQCSVNSKFSYADSRLIIAPMTFIQQFLTRKSQIDDSKNMIFEDVFLNTIREVNTYYYFPFSVEPQIIGMSGSTGEVYQQSQHSHNNRLSYFRYQLWIVVHHPEYSLKRLTSFQVFIIRLTYYITYACTKINK